MLFVEISIEDNKLSVYDYTDMKEYRRIKQQYEEYEQQIGYYEGIIDDYDSHYQSLRDTIAAVVSELSNRDIDKYSNVINTIENIFKFSINKIEYIRIDDQFNMIGFCIRDY